MINIVDRLRATADFGIPDYTNSKLLREASDEIVRLRDETDEWEKSHNTLVKEIERLREENARLRAALKPFVKTLEWNCTDADPDDACIDHEGALSIGDLRAARAAIRGEEKDG